MKNRNSRLKVVLLGAGGQLGSELHRVLQDDPQKITLYPYFGQTHFNLCDSSELAHVVLSCEPDLVINCAAFNGVDLCERSEVNRNLAMQTNAEMVGNLGRICKLWKIGLIHFSTDAVFSGTKDGSYTEDDEPVPVNVYGRTKLHGELRLVATGANAMVVRTSWLWSFPSRSSFVSKLILSMDDPLRVVDDVVGIPTAASDLAQVVGDMVLGFTDPHEEIGDSYRGIFHICSMGRPISKFALAQRLFDVLGVKRQIVPIKSSEWEGAPRPGRVILDCSKARAKGLLMPDWLTAIQELSHAAKERPPVLDGP